MRSRPLAAAALALLDAVIAGIAIIVAITDGGGCGPGAPSGPPSKEAERDIPDDFLRLYQQAGAKHRIPGGRSSPASAARDATTAARNNPACTPQPGASGPGSPNFVGASGPMQIGIGCAAGNIWAIRKVDGGDGMTGAHDPADAIATAAIILIKDKGAPQDKPIDAYRATVRLQRRRTRRRTRRRGLRRPRHRGRPALLKRCQSSRRCRRLRPGRRPRHQLRRPRGPVRLARGAERPGVTTKPIVRRYVAAMSGLIGRPIVIATGTNHSQYTTSGSVSDHWTGYAADIGMAANGDGDDGSIGDRIMTACLILAGVPRERAIDQAEAVGSSRSAPRLAHPEHLTSVCGRAEWAPRTFSGAPDSRRRSST